jgi:hypothetical protein
MSSKYIIVPFKSKNLQGVSFAIDEQDYETYVKSMPSWFLGGAKNNYATSDWTNCPGGRRKIRLHRFLLMGTDDDPLKVVDHINGDTLDNRRCNLRILSKGANVSHRANMNVNNTSGIRGVCWCTTNKRWIGSIQHNEEVWWKKSFEEKDEAIIEIEKQRKLYNATYGISELHVEKLQELIEPNKIMMNLYENGTYVHNKRSDNSREKYNEARRKVTADKREKLKQELLNEPQTYDVITKLRSLEGDERKANSKLTGEKLSVEEKRKVINEGKRLKKENSITHSPSTQ